MKEYKTSEEKRAKQKAYREANRDYYLEYAKKYNPKYSEMNAEQRKEYSKAYHSKVMSTFEGRTKKLFRSAQGRAKIRGLEFDLVYEDIVWPTHCPLLEVELDYEYTGCKSDYSPSLDRKDNTKGYTKENTWVVSCRANYIKRDATPKELMTIAKNLI